MARAPRSRATTAPRPGADGRTPGWDRPSRRCSGPTSKPCAWKGSTRRSANCWASCPKVRRSSSTRRLRAKRQARPCASCRDSPSKVAPAGYIDSLAPGVYAADSLSDALAQRHALQAGESIITRDGVWIGRSWLRVSRDQDLHAGVLAREQELRAEREAEDRQQGELQALERRHGEARAAAETAEQERARRQEELNQAHARHAEAKARRDGLSARGDYLNKQLELLGADEGELARQIDQIGASRQAARERLAEAKGREDALESTRARAEQERDRLRQAQDDARAHAERDRNARDGDRASGRAASIGRGVARQRHRTTHDARAPTRSSGVSELNAQLVDSEAPLAAQQTRLSEELAQRIRVESELADARRAVEATDAGVREMEQGRAQEERRVEEARAAFDTVHIVVEQLRTRRGAYEEQLSGDGFSARGAARRACGGCDGGSVGDEAAAGRVAHRAPRPDQPRGDRGVRGAARAQAISGRQHADVSEALATLEQAIRKIDRETRTRFQETFDKVDARLEAHLPATLRRRPRLPRAERRGPPERGVTVMARPPGKRNSSIHLLSGGEKALTAVALVFAIFKLNPAPFCMLDEVDAPLDDTNAARFCGIVRDRCRNASSSSSSPTTRSRSSWPRA